MIVKRGDVIESEFGKGKIIAITEDWIIHETTGKSIYQVAISRGNDMWWVPADAPKEDVDDNVTADGDVEV